MVSSYLQELNPKPYSCDLDMIKPDRMSELLFLTIDGGTESVRVGLFDAYGTLLATAAQPYPTYFPQPGWAEQDPDEWWHALLTAMRVCIANAKTRIDPFVTKRIAGICLDATTCTLVALDSTGAHLRPALLWMDVRAADQAQRIFETHHPALVYSPSGLAAEWMLPKALWLHEHEPEVYARTTHLIEYTDWIAHKLCGTLALNLNTVTQRWLYNGRSWQWPTDLFASMGLPDLTSKFPSQIAAPGQRLGGLLLEVAQAIGAPELANIPVFEGGGDAFIGLLGLNVVRPGSIGLITGSSNVLGGFFDRSIQVPGLLGGFPDAVVPGLWLMEAGQASTGSILAWFKRNFALDLPDDSAYHTLDQQAAHIEMGAGGVITLDHFQGNRTPYTDSHSRGALWGLSLASTRAHVFRALMEGIVYGTRQILELLQQTGGSTTSISACGGATHSPVFMQLYADICGVPIAVMQVPEAPLLGGAMLAAVGAGVYADLPTAAQAMTHVAKVYQPDAAQHAQSHFYYEQYKHTYSSLRELMHRQPPVKSLPN